MTYMGSPSDRGLIRRALNAMCEMSTDELTGEDLEGMYSENVTFIVAALRGLTSEHRHGLPIVTENFSEREVLRLGELLTLISTALDPPTRTWYYDDENTHGIKGLACVSDEFSRNLVGVGPDHEFTGTADELVASLRGLGFTELDTDDEELSRAWEHGPNRPTPRVDVTGKTELTVEEVELLQVEQDKLYASQRATAERINEISRAIIRSGESKLRKRKNSGS